MPLGKRKGASSALPDRSEVDERNIFDSGLRGGEADKRKRVVPPRGGRKLRDSTHFFYPADYGDRSSIPRGSMGDSVSEALNERTPFDRTAPASARAVRSLTQAGRTELQANSTSRNHILADSRIRVILDDVLRARQAPGGLGQAQRDSIARFLEALTGGDPNRPLEAGREILGRLETKYDSEADPRHRLTALEPVYNEIANGTENLRYGRAFENGRISNQFDPVIIDNRLDSKTWVIRDAVMDLARNRVIDFKRAFDSLGVVREKATGLDVSSSVSRSLDMTRTGGRATIDYFRGPLPSSRFERSYTFEGSSEPALDRLAGSARFRPVAQEWHHDFRPTPEERPAAAIGDAAMGDAPMADGAASSPAAAPMADLFRVSPASAVPAAVAAAPSMGSSLSAQAELPSAPPHPSGGGVAPMEIDEP